LLKRSLQRGEAAAEWMKQQAAEAVVAVGVDGHVKR